MTDNGQVSLLRNQLKGAFELLEGVMADVTEEHAHWTPPGIANPIGASAVAYRRNCLPEGVARAKRVSRLSR